MFRDFLLVEKSHPFQWLAHPVHHIRRVPPPPPPPPPPRVFNASLSTGDVPVAWLQAHITPVFKHGDRTSVTNYRPVALTSVLCKLLEGIVDRAIQDHIDTYGLANNQQHGFTKGRSCVTQLTNVLHTWHSILDLPRPPRVDAVFLDMSRAFDKMPHHILLRGLATDFNIRGTLWKWIYSFLSNRTQKVIFLGHASSWANVTSGVPQGSVLGPKLFNLFINSISSSVSSHTALFADDMVLFRQIDSAEDEEQVQKDLDALLDWSHRNGMTFNPSKSKAMHITRKRRFQAPIYRLGDVPLSSAPSFRYLGVEISSNLTWNTHIESIVSRANRLLGFIRVMARGASTNAIFALYKALVLPILEYAIPAWYPTTCAQTQQLERVQRTATRLALKQARGEMSYVERLEVLHWSMHIVI